MPATPAHTATAPRWCRLLVCLAVAPSLLLIHPPTAVAARQVRDITLRTDPDRVGFGAYTETWGDNLVFDKNGDGNPDVLLSYHSSRGWEIWLGSNDGGFTFDRSLLRKDRHNCRAADFGGPEGRGPDGRTDLYCVRGANSGTNDSKSNELLLQQADGGFVNVARVWGVDDPSGRGRTVEVLDARGNGATSLFVGNKEANLFPSVDHIFEQMGDRFVERRTGGLPSQQDSRCSATGDFDRDGRQDFLSCSVSLRLYRNRTTPAGPVTYREVAAAEGLLSGRRMADAELLDLDQDGWQDLVTVTGNALDVRLNTRRTPHFSEVDYRLPLTGGAGFCSGRANGDDATDLLVVQGLASRDDAFQQPDRMLINDGSGKEFETVPVPQPPRRDGLNGNGDTCSVIPHYRGHRAAWTINNGKSIYRPVAGKDERLGYRQLVLLGR